MKLAIGINIFGTFHRQELCIEGLLKLKDLFGNTIDLYNIQPKDNPIIHDKFETIYFERSSLDVVPEGKQNKPIVKSMFNALGEINCDYFLFSNSDIIISNRFIQTIIDNQDRDAFSGSRLDIQDIQTLDDEVSPVRYQVTGFDTFVIKTKWWNENKDKFPEYIYAEPEWDVMYATICKENGNTMFFNKWPAGLFHVKHPIAWDKATTERDYNVHLSQKVYTEQYNKWHRYMQGVLLRRQPPYALFNHFENEEELEGAMF